MMIFFYSIRWMPELQEMIGQMKDKIANRLKPKRKNLPTTGNLTTGNFIC